MKKIIYLLSVAFLLCFQGIQAQQMPAPDPNTPNVLFLKYSTTLNRAGNNREAQVRISENEAIWRPTYIYLQKLVGERGVSERFYVPNPDEFAYIDPTVYNAVSLDLNQLYNLLNPKNVNTRQAYLKTFHEIYLIDYDQNNPKATSKVKIMRVKPCNFWF